MRISDWSSDVCSSDLNQGLVDFSPDDAELAAAIAHELAHNILRHRARLDAAGVDRGLAKQFGRNARMFKQTEIEADRPSVRSDELRVGKEGVSTCKYRWARYHEKKKKNKTKRA